VKTALLVAPGKVEIRDVPVPSPERGEARVRIKQAGICGTDYALFLGHLGAKLPLISGTYDLDELPQAFENFRSLKRVKTLIRIP